MHVPEDAFKNELGHNISPERKAATALGNLFTMAATRVILDQFTGTRHRSPVYYKMVRRPNRDERTHIPRARPSRADLVGRVEPDPLITDLFALHFFEPSAGGLPQREPAP
jgi:hypothetical protein